MKNAAQIITSLQYKPQYRKISQYKCLRKLTSSLLPSIQNNIKYSFIKDGNLHIVISSTLNKYDKDNIINSIKMILKSPMISQSETFLECSDIKIDDVFVYTNHKPLTTFTPYCTNSASIKYKERASGTLNVEIRNKKLKETATQIQQIIKEHHGTD